MRAELGRPLLELARMQHRDNLARDRAAERVAAERRTVLPRLEDAEHLRRGHHSGNRYDATAECLAEHVHVRDHVVVLACERRSGPAETGLDLVGHHECAPSRAQLADRAKEAW